MIIVNFLEKVDAQVCLEAYALREPIVVPDERR